MGNVFDWSQEQAATADDAHLYGRLVGHAIPCEDVTLADFLHAAKGQPRFYWANQSDDLAFAGVGTAVELMAWGQQRFGDIQRQARHLFDGALQLSDIDAPIGPRLFGGFAFRDDFVPDETWADFTPAHFVLPHYMLVRSRGQHWLTINVQVLPEEDPESLRDDLHEALQQRVNALRSTVGQIVKAQAQLVDVSYPLFKDAWAEDIHAAQRHMASGDLKKVVLARVSEVRFADRVNVDAALDYLAEHYTNSIRFLFEPRPYHAFYGATPELLVSVQGAAITTMGLAGSIRRGATPEEDAMLIAHFLQDPKEREEHQIVVDRMCERLRPLVDVLDVGETGVLQLGNIQHLHTSIEGDLHQPAGVLPVIAELHPTPAMGGDPRDVAMQLIRETERVPRGWYASPVGWIGADLDGQFAVAIRSAVAQEKRVWLYAGAGMVADSVPEKEWHETGLKFRPMLGALGIQDGIDHA